MSKIIDKCPNCNKMYENDDTVSKFKWFCSELCRAIAELKKKDKTLPDKLGLL